LTFTSRWTYRCRIVFGRPWIPFRVSLRDGDAFRAVRPGRRDTALRSYR
jgi:hypothetical protein